MKKKKKKKNYRVSFNFIFNNSIQEFKIRRTNLIREKLVILDGYVRVTGGLIDANTYEQNTVRVVQGGQCLIL